MAKFKDIIVKRPKSGWSKAECPNCKEMGKRVKPEALGVHLVEGIAKCHKCDWVAFDDNKKGDKKAMKSATPINDPSGKIQKFMEAKKEHPHAEAMADHESHSREHKDNSYDNPNTSGKHHMAAYHAHRDAADHLEYGRTKQAKASAEKALEHAKKAKAAGGADEVAGSADILKKHHSATNESFEGYGISGNKISSNLLDAIAMVKERKDLPHQDAIDDHRSHSREHKDNSYDSPNTSGKHHMAAYHAHQDAADHLEYGRIKQAKASAEKALHHAKKAKAAGGADEVAGSADILKKHH